MATAGKTDVVVTARTDDALSKIEAFSRKTTRVINDASASVSSRISSVSANLGLSAQGLANAANTASAAFRVGLEAMRVYASNSLDVAQAMERTERAVNRMKIALASKVTLGGTLLPTEEDLQKYRGMLDGFINPFFDAVGGSGAGDELNAAVRLQASAKAAAQIRSDIASIERMTAAGRDTIAKAREDASAWAKKEAQELEASLKLMDIGSEAEQVQLRAKGLKAIAAEKERRISVAIQDAEKQTAQQLEAQAKEIERIISATQAQAEAQESKALDKFAYVAMLEKEVEISKALASGDKEAAQRMSEEMNMTRDLIQMRRMGLNPDQMRRAEDAIIAKYSAETAGTSPESGQRSAFGLSSGNRSALARVFAMPGTNGGDVGNLQRQQLSELRGIREELKRNGGSRWGP